MNDAHFTYTFGRTVLNLSLRTHIMGVLNVTPDSFSDGGMYFEPRRAVDRALQMIDEGADIVDVGGESTRPKSVTYGEGAISISVEEELKRVLPVITQLSRQSPIPISIDTTKAGVAAKALDAGATIVNDISGFRFDSNMPKTVAQAGASVILMHTKGTPKTMQINPSYEDMLGEILSYLADAIRLAEREGVKQIVVDPGIGFGKTQTHNLQILNCLAKFKSLGYPILVGASRKAFIGNILNAVTEDRIEGSVAAAVVSVMNGANIVRVHDVKETKRALLVADAIRNQSLEG
jgi:dihydropteroate synthase